MTTVADVTGWLEQLAPARLAEPWDNVGLLWGDPAGLVQGVMTCLTVTPATAAEAIEEQAALIVSHHPVLFRGVKRIRADLPETGHLWKLARAGIAIASPHTAFDNTHNGINDILCRRLGLVDVSPLRPWADSTRDPATAPWSFKVVVFTPESDREVVSSAAFRAGAGRIGAYEECSFAIPGEGTFFGTEAANPSVGERGRRETVRELRLEVVCPPGKLGDVLAAIRAHHSYEEPAIDVYALRDNKPDASPCGGGGRVGRLVEPRGLAEFALSVGRALGRVSVGMVGRPDRGVERVAIACGAGDDFLKDAAQVGADVLVTGEARFHRAIEAEALGIGLLTAGHYASERSGVEELAGMIAMAFPNLTVWPSRIERDPIRLIGPT
ncbi:MAG: Nif3-like dinuclear metal center hexameric protein [Isosphaerales bacterium]